MSTYFRDVSSASPASVKQYHFTPVAVYTAVSLAKALSAPSVTDWQVGGAAGMSPPRVRSRPMFQNAPATLNPHWRFSVVVTAPPSKVPLLLMSYPRLA